MMDTRILTPEQRFELIVECRNSGLTDYQWCKEKGINPGTFYNWIARFRKKGYPNIPASVVKTGEQTPMPQEIVKLELLPDEFPAKSVTSDSFVSPPIHSESTLASTMEICVSGVTVRITNDVHPQLLGMVLKQLGGSR